MFERSKDYNKSLELNPLDFTGQEYVIISTDNRINICSGFIDNINSLTVSVHCDKYVNISFNQCFFNFSFKEVSSFRDITKVYKDKIFHIDKGASSSLLIQNMSQLGGLLEDHEICKKLRRIVIDK